MIERSLGFLIGLAAVASLAYATDSDEPVAAPPETAPLISGLADRADILLISSDELAAAWKPFAEWKTQTGRPTKILTLTEVAAQFEGDDIQQKIRACCLAHIDDQHTRWIVLGGDSGTDGTGQVPDRDTHHRDFFKYDNIPTDLYYLSKGDWDANDDGIYGRFSDDMEAVEYTNGDVSIGRIPVRTAADVAAYTAKVIDYEGDYPTDAFATRMIYACPEPGAYPKLNTSIASLGDAWATGDVQRYFANQTPWDSDSGGDHDLTPANWIEMINGSHVAKMHMHGHGFNNLWVLEDRSTITAQTVKKLKNESAYPIITTVSCWTGEYDSGKDPAISESMLRRAKGGAIAIVAPSREGIPVFHQRSDMRLMMTEGKMDGTTATLTHFWRNALTESKTLGEAFQAAKRAMEPDARKTDGYHFVQCELNLLGDPSLDPRAATPTAIAAEVTTDAGTITVGRVAGCDVCVWDGAERYEVRRATATGTVTFHVTGPGTWTVSAFALNRNASVRRVTTK